MNLDLPIVSEHHSILTYHHLLISMSFILIVISTYHYPINTMRHYTNTAPLMNARVKLIVLTQALKSETSTHLESQYVINPYKNHSSNVNTTIQSHAKLIIH